MTSSTQSPVLTIAVPTFNRAASLGSLVQSLRAACEQGLIELLVVNDGSTHETAEAVGGLAFPGFRFETNPRNLGYGLNFCRLFAECRTPYMLVTADDDDIDAAALPLLIDWLERRRPAFASTQWLTAEGALYRGQRAERPIAPRDFRAASGHAPGLVYDVAASQAEITSVEALVRAEDPMAGFYPQVVLLARLMLAGDCRWYPACVVREGGGLPSQLLDSSGRNYANPLARIEQLIAMERILMALASERFSGDRRIRQMIRQNARSFYWSARESFRARGAPGCERRFDRSAFWYLLRHLPPFRALTGRTDGARALSAQRRLQHWDR